MSVRRTATYVRTLMLEIAAWTADSADQLPGRITNQFCIGCWCVIDRPSRICEECERGDTGRVVAAER